MIARLKTWLAVAVAAVVAVLSFGAMKRREGRQDAKDKANADTLDRIEQGRRAVDRDADPDQRVRDNDGKW